MKRYQKQTLSKPKAKTRLHYRPLLCHLQQMPETLLKTDSHSLKLKTYSVTDSVTECTTFYRKLLKLHSKQTPSQLDAKSRPRHILFYCHLKEKPEALVRMESVADFKNTKEATYKDTRITLTEAILVHFLSLTLNMFQFAGKFLETTNSKK